MILPKILRDQLKDYISSNKQEFLLLKARMIERNYCDFETTDELFIEQVLHLNMREFEEISNRINSKIFQSIVNDIKNIWLDFVEKVKSNFQKEISTVQKYPFCPKKKVNEIFDNIITPITITIKSYKVKNILCNLDFSDDIELITYLNKPNDPKRVLICGEGGIGKSYHCLRILNSWLKSKKLNDTLLLYIKLKDIKSNQTLIQAIIEQNSKYKKLEKEVLKHILSNNCEYRTGKKIILLLDGADECIMQNSNILNIIHKTEFWKFSLIVWSRYIKEEDIRRTYELVLEIDGFKGQNMKDFFNNYCGHDTDLKGKKLRKTVFKIVKNNEKLLKLSNNPFMASMIAFYYQSNGVQDLEALKIKDLFTNVIDMSLKNNNINKDEKEKLLKEISKKSYLYIKHNSLMVIKIEHFQALKCIFDMKRETRKKLHCEVTLPLL